MDFLVGFIILLLAGYGGYKILDDFIDYLEDKHKEKERINKMLEDYDNNKWKWRNSDL